MTARRATLRPAPMAVEGDAAVSVSPWTCFGEHRLSRRRLWARRVEIARIVTRHGLGLLTGSTGIGRFVPFHHGWFHHEIRREPYERHEHLRMLFEDLGATYIKIGQILSTRPDLLDERYRSELARLQDAVPLQESWSARDEVERQLARPLRDAFSDFGETPIAAASIGQAYCARLMDGTEVVVKVRRPGVVEAVRGVTFPSGDLYSDPGPGLIACLTTSAVHEPLRWSTAASIIVASIGATRFARPAAPPAAAALTQHGPAPG